MKTSLVLIRRARIKNRYFISVTYCARKWYGISILSTHFYLCWGCDVPFVSQLATVILGFLLSHPLIWHMEGDTTNEYTFVGHKAWMWVS